MPDDVVTRIREYHMPDGEGDSQVWEPVTPIKVPDLAPVFISEADADYLELAAEALIKLGAIEIGLRIHGMAMQRRLASCD